MKKFLCLWAVALAVAFALPLGAEATDYPVTITSANASDLNAAIKAVLDESETVATSDTITITINSPATISGAAISIPYLYVSSDAQTYPVNNVTVNGGTLTVAGNYRHFEVKKDGKAEFNNVTFQGLSTTTATLGGGVKVSDGEATFSGGTFQYNDAANGGALEIAGGTVTLGGTVNFNTNYATNGGAIWMNSARTITGGTFTGNTAEGDGGAIYVDGDSVTLTVNGGTFTGNSAKSNGGAICATNGTVRVNGGSFGSSTSPNTAAKGGAIYANSVVLSGTGTKQFINNQATTAGGAIFTLSSLNIPGGTFTSNKVTEGNGGAVRSDGTVTVGDGTFKGNSASAEGGAISAGTTATISGGTFGDSSSPNTAANGGVVHATTVNVTGGTFDNNTATTNGGAVYASTTADIDGGTFIGNKATKESNDGRGGAVYSGGTVTGSGGTFGGDNNEDGNAANIGGAVYATTIDMSGVVFANNHATGSTASHGGATYSGGQSKFSNCYFNANTAAGNGGAAYAAGLIDVSSSTFYANGSSQIGGAICTVGSGSKITGSIFETNHANGVGGAVISSGNSTTMAISDSLFIANNVLAEKVEGISGGGAVASFGHAESWSLVRCTFDSNEAIGSESTGGAGYVDARTFNVANCTFYNNKTDGSGGALYLAATTTGGAVVFNTFARNTGGSSGQGNAVHSLATLKMGANIMARTSTASGSDLYATDGLITSLGYNLVGVYGDANNSSQSFAATSNFTATTGDDQNSSNYTFQAFFGAESSTGLADNSVTATRGCSSSLGASPSYSMLRTLALQTTDANPALAIISVGIAGSILASAGADIALTDERINKLRPSGNGALWAIGAYDDGYGSGGNNNNNDNTRDLWKIEISQLPNTLRTVGQTASLFVRGFDVNGNIISGNLSGVTWNSSASSVAKIDQNGTVKVYRLGTTVISATYGSLSDSVTLNVTEEMSYTNVHEGVWNQLGIYDGTLASLTFADADPALVDAAAFQSDFRGIWNVAATQVTEIKEEDSSFSAPTRGGSLRPGIGASFANRLPGDLIPLKYQWTYTWEELSSMLGRSVSSTADLSNLSALKIDFEVNNGSVLPVIGTASVNTAARTQGINAGDAQNGGSLNVEEASGGASFNLTAYVANVASSGGNDGPQFVQNLLVVPDGTADGTLAGTMWTTGTGSSGEGGGGGGGCDASGLGLFALLIVVPAFMRRR